MFAENMRTLGQEKKEKDVTPGNSSRQNIITLILVPWDSVPQGDAKNIK